MASNPFHYGTPVDAEHFAGRGDELAALCARMRDGINVVVVSPRRYGKTSLILRSEERLGPAAAVVRVNVLRCRDVADLAAKLAGAAYRLPGGRWHRARAGVGEFARRLRVNPSVTFAPDGSPRFSFASDLADPDAEAVIADVYGLLAGETGRRAPVLVLDEFQAVADHGAHLPALLKALADEHPGVSLVLAGSKAHLMERLAGAPLYGMAERLVLGPVDGGEMVAYLEARVASVGRAMAEGVARLIVERAGPVPNDIQRLAYVAFEQAAGEIGAGDVDAGLATSAAHEAAGYAETYSRLSGGARRVLVSVTAGRATEVFSGRFARSVRLANAASVRRAVDSLIESDLVAERAGRLVVADPFFAAWLAGVDDDVAGT